MEKMRYVFKTKRTLATNNPDDIALLQVLSAAVYYGTAHHIASNCTTGIWL